MDGWSHFRKRGAGWRMAVVCLLAALAFAPVARAVCDLEHVAAVALMQPGCHDGAASGSQVNLAADCCDGATAMTQPGALVSETGMAGGSSAAHAAIVLPFTAAPRFVLLDVPRSRRVAPSEPILLRLPRRLT